MSSTKPRARDLGIPFDGTTGHLNAITDVAGVWVGHRYKIDNVNINTGVTAILPLGNNAKSGDGIDTSVLAAWFSLNGCGEVTGTTWIEESGFLEGPIMLTNTASVGTVRNAVIKYAIKQQSPIVNPDEFALLLPIVAETYDGWLNDILGFHVTADMVNGAIDDARATNVDEGNVGGGTGMTCYDWKGGIGTSSRMVFVYATEPNADGSYSRIGPGPYTVGVLVQANQGTYWDLVIRGVPLGTDPAFAPPPNPADQPPGGQPRRVRKSSIIVVIATDAPLLPNQLKRLARRATHGIARTGTITNDDSGEIFIAFSTANPGASDDNTLTSLCAIPNESMDPLFEATVQATEEAIINAMIAAETLTGRGGHHTAYAITDAPLPSAPPSSLSLIDMMKKYNRWIPPAKKFTRRKK